MCITLFSTFLWRPLHDYDVKPPYLMFYGGRGHTMTNCPTSFWTWIKSLRIQLLESLPTFDILSGSKQTRLSLKERKFIFLPTFLLLSSSSLLKVPNIIYGIPGWRCWGGKLCFPSWQLYSYKISTLDDQGLSIWHLTQLSHTLLFLLYIVSIFKSLFY